MNGRFDTYKLYTNTAQSIYTPSTDRWGTVTVNLVNRTDRTANIHIAVTTAESTITAVDYVEYNRTIPANETFEKGNLVLAPGTYVTVISDISGVYAQSWGYELGDEILPISALAIAPDLVAPTISNISPIEINAGSEASYQLQADEIVTWSLVSGTLPVEVSLSSTTGILSWEGTFAASATDYTFRATDEWGNTTDAILNIEWTAPALGVGGAETVAGGAKTHTFTSIGTSTFVVSQ